MKQPAYNFVSSPTQRKQKDACHKSNYSSKVVQHRKPEIRRQHCFLHPITKCPQRHLRSFGCRLRIGLEYLSQNKLVRDLSGALHQSQSLASVLIGSIRNLSVSWLPKVISLVLDGENHSSIALFFDSWDYYVSITAWPRCKFSTLRYQ